MIIQQCSDDNSMNEAVDVSDLGSSWSESYLLTALQLNKAIREKIGEPFLDCYYGPPLLASKVDKETSLSGERLRDQMSMLIDEQ